jgi:hypothetical protein
MTRILTRRQALALGSPAIAAFSGCSKLGSNGAVPRTPREDLPLACFQNFEAGEIQPALAALIDLEQRKLPREESDRLAKEITARRIKLRLVDSSGRAVIEANQGFSWTYEDLLVLSPLAAEARGPVGRERLRDVFLPPAGITREPVAGRTVQACMVTGTLLSSSPYLLVGYFNDGLATVYDDATKKRGFVNTAGKLAFPARFHGAYTFFEGLASVTEQAGEGEVKAGAIDTSGKYVLAPQYRSLSPMAGGWMRFRANDRRGIVNAKGKEISIPGNQATVTWLGDYAVAQGETNLNTGAQTWPVLLTKEGKVVPLDRVTNAYEMPRGFAAQKVGEEGFRWYDSDFKPMYDKPLANIGIGAGDVAPVRETEQWGLMGADGKWRVKPRYVEITSFSHGLAAFFTEGSRAGFLTPAGEEIVIPDMTAGDCMGHFLYVVHGNSLPGFYTREGKLIERLNVISRG